MMSHPNELFMRQAIAQAQKAAQKGQYPIGALVVCDDTIIASEHTTLHETNDPTAHAEMNAIRKASDIRASRYLEHCWLYTTQEPCPMCSAAAIWAKMEGIVFGASMEDALKLYQSQKNENFSWRQIKIPAEYIVSKGNPTLALHKNFMRQECLKLYEASNIST